MFTKILNDLSKRGFSDAAIAAQVKACQTTISRLRNGSVSEPMYWLGTRIIALHEQKCKKSKK